MSIALGAKDSDIYFPVNIGVLIHCYLSVYDRSNTFETIAPGVWVAVEDGICIPRHYTLHIILGQH